MVIWLTGLSGSGKSTLSMLLAQSLRISGERVCILDGDRIRSGLCSDLGFWPKHRRENMRRVAEVAKLLSEAHITCIVSLISPFRMDRVMARDIVNPQPFVEVYVECPLSVCEERDPKGLYRKARSGEIPYFTGINQPYQAPLHPEIRVQTDTMGITECVETILKNLR